MHLSTIRTWTVATASGVALLATATAASADDGYDGGGLGRDGQVGVIIVGGQERSVADLEAIASSDGPQYVAVPAHHDGDRDDDNQGYCRTVEWRVVPEGSTAEEVREQATEEYWTYIRQSAPYFYEFPGAVDWEVPCEVDPLDALPAEILESMVREAAFGQLPRPEPAIAPGWGLPGLRMYLDTGEDHNLSYAGHVDVEILDFRVRVAFTGEGVSTVDWGDGTVQTYHESGGPWPHGAVNHVWTDAGTYDVTVTDAWVVSYDVDGRLSGEFAGTLDGVTVPDFEIQERRAVRMR